MGRRNTRGAGSICSIALDGLPVGCAQRVGPQPLRVPRPADRQLVQHLLPVVHVAHGAIVAGVRGDGKGATSAPRNARPGDPLLTTSTRRNGGCQSSSPPRRCPLPRPDTARPRRPTGGRRACGPRGWARFGVGPRRHNGDAKEPGGLGGRDEPLDRQCRFHSLNPGPARSQLRRPRMSR